MRRKIGLVGWVHVVAVCLALAVVLVSVKRLSNLRRGSAQDAHAGSPGARAANSSSVKLVLPPVYRYSVIPGGVRSPEELEYDVVHDPVVASHYSDFDAVRARVVRLDRDEMMYVSYRMGDRVFWTNKKLKIPKGETVITDGTNTARTRCGNRLSAYEMQPTNPRQPRFDAFDAVAPAHIDGPNSDWRALPLPGLAAPWSPSPTGLAGSGGPIGDAIPPGYYPIVGGGGAPVAVPEPSALEMLTFALAAVFGAGIRRRRRRKPKIELNEN